MIAMIDVGHLKSCVGRQLDNGNAMPGSIGKAGQGLAALEDGWARSGVHPQPQPTLHQLQLQAVTGGRVVRVHKQTITRFCPKLKTQTRVCSSIPLFELCIACL